MLAQKLQVKPIFRLQIFIDSLKLVQLSGQPAVTFTLLDPVDPRGINHFEGAGSQAVFASHEHVVATMGTGAPSSNERMPGVDERTR